MMIIGMEKSGKILENCNADLESLEKEVILSWKSLENRSQISVRTLQML